MYTALIRNSSQKNKQFFFSLLKTIKNKGTQGKCFGLDVLVLK